MKTPIAITVFFLLLVSFTAPHDTHLVVIPSMIAGASFPEISGSVTIAHLRIAFGASLSVVSSGTLSVQPGPDTSLLVIEGELMNDGTIHVTGASQPAIEIDTDGTLVNYGQCHIMNTPFHGLINAGILINETSGVLTLQQCDSIPVLNAASGQIINSGVMEISRD